MKSTGDDRATVYRVPLAYVQWNDLWPALETVREHGDLASERAIWAEILRRVFGEQALQPSEAGESREISAGFLDSDALRFTAYLALRGGDRDAAGSIIRTWKQARRATPASATRPSLPRSLGAPRGSR